MAAVTLQPSTGENRLLSLLQYFTELESQHRVNNLAARKTSPQTLQLQQKFLKNVVEANRRTSGLSTDEKKTLQYLRHLLRRNKALQSPTLAKRFLYSRPVNWLFNRLLGRQRNFRLHKGKVTQFEKRTALEVNAANLTQEMVDHGFRVQLDGPIRRMMAAGLKEFAIPYYDIALPDTNYALHFKRLEGTDAYFFEKYDATHRKTRVELLRDPSTPEPVTVHLSNAVVFSAEEARQLAADRPLQKTIAGENVFIVRDPDNALGVRKVYFDLERELDPFVIAELAPGRGRELFLSDLAKGKQREATLRLPDGSQEIVLVRMELDPLRQQYELAFHSREGRPLDASTLMRYSNTEPAAELTTEQAVPNRLFQFPSTDETPAKTFSPNVERGMDVLKRVLLAKAQQAHLSHGMRSMN